jgi:DNA ligase 1
MQQKAKDASDQLSTDKSGLVNRRDWLAAVGGVLGAGALQGGLGGATTVLALASWPGQTLAKANAPVALLLAKDYRGGVDVSRYLVSEKLDGVRALWDGKVLRFRSGQVIAAPAWFVAKLPAVALDGELWLARGQFDELSGIARKAQTVDEEWRRVSYQVFELPGGEGSFESRAAQLQAIVKQVNWPQLQAPSQFRVKDEAQLKAKLDALVKAGGEGLMLHRADAAYLTGRSDVLLKFKPVQDAEATVIAHVAGKGKYAGQLGALQVRTEEGHVFKLGTGLSDEQRRNPPPIGSVVTYSYRDTTPSGKPRFAVFLRVREP